MSLISLFQKMSLVNALGEYEEAEQHLHESLIRFRELGHTRGMVGTLSDLGHLGRRRGAYSQAKRYYRKAVALSKELGYRDGTARCLYELSDVCRDIGEYRQARQHVEKSLAIYRDLGSLDRVLALYRLGRLSTLLGDYAAAERHLQDSLALGQEAESSDGIGHALHHLGELALARGDHREAQYRFRESLARFEQVGEGSDPWGTVKSLLGLGRAAGALGIYPAAQEHLREALTTALSLPSVPYTLDVLVEFAALLADVGAQEKALELAAFTRDHPVCRRATKDRARDLFSELAAPLSPQAIAAVRERILSRELDQIAQDALSSSL